MLDELWAHVLDLLFPPRCAGCGQFGAWFCSHCASRCQPLTSTENGREHTLLGSTSLTSSAGVFRFSSPLREAIHDLKYKRHSVLADPIAELTVQIAGTAIPLVDAIVPVPLYPRRQRERGFNQAELLGRAIGLRLALPLLGKGLRRSRSTHQQVGLDRAGRRANMAGAFRWQGSPPPRRVLLLDDVVTTGATMEACAAALRVAGAEEVHGWAIARDGV